MPALTHDLAQGHQCEFPLGKERMGKRQAIGLKDQVVVEDQVDIDRPGGIAGTRCRALKLLCSAVPPQFALDRLASVEHLERREIGCQLEGLVRETVLAREAPRGAFVPVRAAQYGAHAGIDQLLRRLERTFHVAQVAAHQKCHSCHRHKCFIILLTERAKWVNTIVGLPFCAICAEALSISAISGSIFCEPTNGANFVQKASSSPHR